MATRYEGIGNLGKDPVFKDSVGDDERQVAELWIYFDRPVQDKESKEFEDKGGFWLDVSAWDRLAIDVNRVLKKGMRVKVGGSLKRNTWQDESSGEERSKLVLNADEITLVMTRIESVQIRPKREATINE